MPESFTHYHRKAAQIGRLLLIIGLLVMAFTRTPVLGQQSAPRPFWSEINAFIAQDKHQGIQPCRTLFVGSSSIRFWTSLQTDMPRRSVIQRGFGGGHLTHVVQYFNLMIEPHKPRAIVLYAGENDIASGDAPSDVLATLQKFMKRKTKALGDTPVYFISIKPSHYHWDKFAIQSDANNLIKDLAQARTDLVFIDVASLMLDNGKPKKIFVADGLHMNRAGYALWAEAVGTALARAEASEAPHCKN